LSCKKVHNWAEKFSHGRSKVADDAQPGCPVETATEATVQRVEVLIRVERRIMIDSRATALRCPHGLAYSIMHDHLKLRKVCSQWVPREPKEGSRKNELLGLSLQHPLRYADEGEYMLNRIVTGDESGVRHCQPE
jgi:hypothetical protein